MAPSKTVGSSGTNPPSSARRSTPTQRTSNTMDSSRHGADDMSPEPATAAMIDVSSWAQRGLVLENKDLRRTLEMTKSAHTAQLAQIAKRHKTEKEELEVKLEAETYRLAAQQRTLDELAVRLERVQGDNGKLTESVQSLDKGLIAKTEENSRLQRELEDSKSKLESTGEELKAIKAKQEELLGRESRVAAVLNDQHHKIMNLSQAYHEQEGDKVQLQSMLETAEKEVTRLRSRLSGILDTLVKVVHDNGDVMDDVDLPGENVEMKDASMRESNKKPEGRKRTRATDQQASHDPSSLPHRHLVNTAANLSLSVEQADQSSPIPMTPKNASVSTATVTTSSAATSPRLDASVNGRTGVRAKRRRIVSDPEDVSRSQQIQVKEEPGHSDTMMLDKSATEDVAALDMQESVTVTQVEVSIPTPMDTELDTLREGGGDSPERAAVESAIDAQDGDSASQPIGEEEIGTRKKLTTYQKRKAKEAIQTLHVGDTPNSKALGKGLAAEKNTPVDRTSPGESATTATTPQTSAYSTRAKRSLKNSSIHDRPSVHAGSPFSKKRLDKHGHAQSDDKMSPGAIKVKEEVLDPHDGRPRITGGDDEEDPLCI